MSSTSTIGALAVDRTNGVIRGVSVVTGGVLAKGHDLWTDQITLEQIAEHGQRRGKVLVRENHKRGGEPTGVDAAVGWLQNFRVEGEHTRADFHIYPSHPKRDLYLDVAEKTPELMGLSAAFVPAEDPVVIDGTKRARVEELVTVDIVCQPAANPGGWFEANGQTAVIEQAESLETFALRRLQELSSTLRRPRDSEHGRASRVAATGAGGFVGAAAALRSSRGRRLSPGDTPKVGDIVERDVLGVASHRGVVLPSGRVLHVKRGSGENTFVGTSSIGTDRLGDFRPTRVHRPDVSPPIRNPHTKSGKMHYNVISANSDQKLRGATGVRFPDQVGRTLAGAAVGSAVGYVGARIAQSRQKAPTRREFSAAESTAANTISQRDREDLARRVKAARERAARRQRIKATVSGGSLGAATGAILAPNALRGARVGGGIGALTGALWPALFDARFPRRTDLALALPGAASARSTGGAMKRIIAALRGVPGLSRIAGAAGAGFLAGRALRKTDQERESPGLVRRATTGAAGAMVGAKLGGMLRRRSAGAVAGGLAGFLFEAPRRREATAFEQSASVLEGLPADVVDALHAIVRENVIGRTAQYASHSLASLSKRLPLSPEQIVALIAAEQLRPVDGRNINSDLAVFDQGDIERLRASLIGAEVDRVVRAHRNDPAVQRDPRALVPIARVAVQAFLKPKTP